MIGDVEFARERAELLELALINDYILLKRQGKLEFAILSSAEVVNRPLDSTLGHIVVTAVRIKNVFFRSHHRRSGVSAALHVDHSRRDSFNFSPRLNDGTSLTLLVVLVNKDTEYLHGRLEAHDQLFDTEVGRQTTVCSEGQV